MSAWLSPVCGRANTMLSNFTASTRFNEGTGSPVNGDRNGGAGAGEREGDGVARGLSACPPPRSASSALVTPPAKMSTAATAMTALCRVHIVAPSCRVWAHRTRQHAVACPHHRLLNTIYGHQADDVLVYSPVRRGRGGGRRSAAPARSRRSHRRRPGQ